MNKKEAIAYAQITLEYMLSSKYNGEIKIESEINTGTRVFISIPLV